ncbi:MAG: DUF1579 family protein [Verrucomicrobia bacterium]|nr:DUF1579 family protein [Cytophagales bacterium]
MKTSIIVLYSLSIFVLLAAVSNQALAQNKADTLKEAAMMKQYIEMSKTNENHKILGELNGEWTFIGKHVFSGVIKRSYEFSGKIVRKAVLEGRYFITETTGGTKMKLPWSQGKLLPYQDMYLEGYDNVKKKFFSSNINNESNTGIITLEGTYNPATKIITYEGESVSHFHRDIVPGTMMKFLVLLKFIDNDHFTLEQRESIDGKEIVTTELKYTRIKN